VAAPNEYTSRVLRNAQSLAARRGCTRVSPEWLLIAILDLPDCTARRLLERLDVSIDELREQLEPRGDEIPKPWWGGETPAAYVSVHLADESERALAHANAEATRRRASLTGTEHLLLGILTQADTDAVRILEAAGASADRLLPELVRLNADIEDGIANPRAPADFTSYAGKPPVVSWATALLVLNLACETVPCTMTPAALLSRGDTSLVPVTYLWTWLASAILIWPVSEGRRWGWSGAVGLLFAKSAAVLGFLAWVAVRLPFHTAARSIDPDYAIVLAIFAPYAAAVFLLTHGLMGVSAWFGVPRRERWRVLLREGWWTLLLTGVLEAAVLIDGAVPSGR